MANTYTQSHVHAVFAVARRAALIAPSFQEDMHKYMTGIINHHGHRLIVVNSMPDHVHLLMGIGMNQAPCDLMRILKGDTSEWINKNRRCPARFEFQRGYGWFHVDRSRYKGVAQYIVDQQRHHRKQNFIQEYKGLLEEEEVPYDARFIFHEPD